MPVTSTTPEIICIPNFSEGRRQETLDAIVHAIAAAGATVLDAGMESDHNRAVIGFMGAAQQVELAVTAAAQVALHHIDLRTHTGRHPRFGALDVVPVVPWGDTTMEQAVHISRCIGQSLADLGLPVFFYEESALHPGSVNLADVRRIGSLGLDAPLTDENAPDLGPHSFHPTAGAVAVGARQALVAYNINLAVADLEAARAIAAEIRRRRDLGEALEGVKALGILLESRGISQVSMNITRPERCRPRTVWEFVNAAAKRLGVPVLESELIGIVSRRHLPDEDVSVMKFRDLREAQFIENWL